MEIMLPLKIILSSVIILLLCDIENVQAKVGDISKEKCEQWGKLKVASKRIKGGTAAKEGEFPHMVAVAYDYNGIIIFQCGGSLISERYVLSAAHCLSYKMPSFLRLGTTNVKEPNNGYKDFNISKTIVHGAYNFSYTKYNLSIADIALFRLSADVTFSKTIMPICLQTSYTFDTKNIIATGWGCTEHLTHSPILVKVTLPVKEDYGCNLLYEAGVPKSTILCAGGNKDKNDFRDTCKADSGSPLQIYKGTQLYAVAVVLAGYDPNFTTFATRISEYLEWIEKNTWGK